MNTHLPVWWIGEGLAVALQRPPEPLAALPLELEHPVKTGGVAVAH